MSTGRILHLQLAKPLEGGFERGKVPEIELQKHSSGQRSFFFGREASGISGFGNFPLREFFLWFFWDVVGERHVSTQVPKPKVL